MGRRNGAGAVARRDFVAGSIAGAASVAVGQPFDTIKVRMQTLDVASRATARQVAMTTVREEGVRALFKGMAAPVVMTSVINAIVFSAKGATLSVLSPARRDPRTGAALPTPLWATVLSGNVAGESRSERAGPPSARATAAARLLPLLPLLAAPPLRCSLLQQQLFFTCESISHQDAASSCVLRFLSAC
jgi:hypothetical protein